MIGGLRNKEPIAQLSFIGTTDTETFECWIEECLLPELKANDVVIMDNARIHKSNKTKELIESKGAILKFQPPYSPFLNKIENYWGFLKKAIGISIKNFNTFNECLRYVCNLEYAA